MRKKKIEIGDVYEINLKGLGYIYAVVVYGNELVFLNKLSGERSIPNEFSESEILFRIPVAVDELRSGTWEKVKKLDVPSNLSKPGVYTRRDIGTDNYSIYSNGIFSPTDRETAKTLEIVAVWFIEHVEERLTSHFEGRRSVILDAMQRNHDLLD